MKITRILFILFFCTINIMGIPAETTGDPDNTILLKCAYSNDLQLQLMALNSLQAKYNKERFIDNELFQIPIDLSQKSNNSQNNKEVQIKAIGILGEIGGQRALDTLTEILISRDNSIILLETVKSASSIIAEDYRDFIRALGSSMKRQHSLFKDNDFALASLKAIDNITLNTGNILTSEILGMMMIYSESVYDQRVKEYSRKLLTVILTER